MSSTDDDLARTASLLNAVFAHEHPLTVDSLRWYYADNPVGPAAVGHVDDDASRLGNYALVPQVFRSATGETRILGVGVDLAVDPAARGGGIFRRTVEDAYDRAIALGHDGILGVANANSAPRMVSTLGWRALDALPVTLLTPIGSTAGFRSARVDHALLAGSEFASWCGEGFASIDHEGFAPVWTPEVLAWRLARPGCSYSIHVSADLVVISTRTKVSGVPFGVILKVLARRTLDAPIPGGRLAAVIARSHRTPFVIHWGRTPWVRLRGVHLPQERMPSPLALVLHRHHERFDEASFELSAFEFLDFDAY